MWLEGMESPTTTTPEALRWPPHQHPTTLAAPSIEVLPAKGNGPYTPTTPAIVIIDRPIAKHISVITFFPYSLLFLFSIYVSIYNLHVVCYLFLLMFFFCTTFSC
jgi:hypothetical protein